MVSVEFVFVLIDTTHKAAVVTAIRLVWIQISKLLYFFIAISSHFLKRFTDVLLIFRDKKTTVWVVFYNRLINR